MATDSSAGRSESPENTRPRRAPQAPLTRPIGAPSRPPRRTVRALSAYHARPIGERVPGRLSAVLGASAKRTDSADVRRGGDGQKRGGPSSRPAASKIARPLLFDALQNDLGVPLSKLGLQLQRPARGSGGGTRVTDEGLAVVHRLPRLHSLWLERTQITSAGLRDHVGKVAGMKRLYLTDTRIDDEGARHLKDLTGLLELNLDGTQLTDAGLVHLHGMKELAAVRLQRTKVTRDGARALAAALPRCRVEYSGGFFPPKR